jgi:lipoate-protein ligase A
VEAYRWLGEVWAEAVRLLGVEPKLVTVQDAKLAGSRQRPFEELIRLACFGTLSPYEVTARGRKLVGLAQVRRRGNVLLQSALHLRFDARSLATVLRSAQADLLAKAFQEAAIGLAEASGRDYAEAEVMAAVERSLARRLGVSLGPDSWTQEELLHAASHEAEVAVT